VKRFVDVYGGGRSSSDAPRKGLGDMLREFADGR
jgi:hypothetical protein